MKRKTPNKPILESTFNSDSSSEDDRLVSMITRGHTDEVNQTPKDSHFLRRVSNIFKKSESKEKILGASAKRKNTSPTILQPLIDTRKISTARKSLVFPQGKVKSPLQQVSLVFQLN